MTMELNKIKKLEDKLFTSKFFDNRKRFCDMNLLFNYMEATGAKLNHPINNDELSTDFKFWDKACNQFVEKVLGDGVSFEEFCSIFEIDVSNMKQEHIESADVQLTICRGMFFLHNNIKARNWSALFGTALFSADYK